MTTVSMYRILVTAGIGFVFFFLAFWVLLNSGVLSLLPTRWQWSVLLGLLAATYLACSLQIRRGLNFELWVPTNSY